MYPFSITSLLTLRSAYSYYFFIFPSFPASLVYAYYQASKDALLGTADGSYLLKLQNSPFPLAKCPFHSLSSIHLPLAKPSTAETSGVRIHSPVDIAVNHLCQRIRGLELAIISHVIVNLMAL